MKKKTFWLAPALTMALVTYPSSSFAQGKAAFIVDMTHAYYAALALCPGNKLNLDGIFAAGKKDGFDKDGVVDIENAILRLNGNTTVPIPSIRASKSVRVASIMINAEISAGKNGQESWCSFRVPTLIGQGFLTPAE